MDLGHTDRVVVVTGASKGIGSGGKVANPVHLPGGAADAALMLATVRPRPAT